MTDIYSVYTILTTVGTGAFFYLWLRKNEIEKLAKAVYDAAKDHRVSEEEFQIIADSLGKVLYKQI